MLKNIFKLFCDKEEKATEEVIFPVCEFNSSNQECDLIKELRKKQDELRYVQEELKKLKENIPASISSFMKFLAICNTYHFLDYIKEYYTLYRNDIECNNIMVTILEHILYEVNMDDIDNMYKELKTLKGKEAIILQKENIKKNLSKDIREIKSKLKIE